MRGLGFVLAFSFLTLGCTPVYYGALEQIGIEKRDILVDRVKDGREAQQDAQEEFSSALDEFRAVVSVDGGELEKQYNRLSDAYDDASDQAQEVRDRIRSIEDVGEDLFKEWTAELNQYQDANLRRRSEDQLKETQTRFNQLVGAMTRAASKMDPVLGIYGDQVLFLKHNLNARAIASLESERVRIEQRVEALIAEMDAAIREADAFIVSMS